MPAPRLRTFILAATAALGLAGCSTYDGYGGGYGYGAPRASVGVYSGWYDGYYYPGSGYYIYDRAGSRHRWNDRHRRYWEARRGHRHRAERHDRRDRREWRREHRGDRNDRREWRRDRDRNDGRQVWGRYESREEAIRARDEAIRARNEARRDHRRGNRGDWRRGNRGNDGGDRRRRDHD